MFLHAGHGEAERDGKSLAFCYSLSGHGPASQVIVAGGKLVLQGDLPTEAVAASVRTARLPWSVWSGQGHGGVEVQ